MATAEVVERAWNRGHKQGRRATAACAGKARRGQDARHKLEVEWIKDEEVVF